MVRFETKLPALRLTSQDLIELEKIFHTSLSENEEIDEEIEIRYDGWSKSYKSINELIEDPLKPDSVRNIQWHIYIYDKGTRRKKYVAIRGRGFLSDSSEIIIEGEEQWVRNLSQKLMEFLKRRKTLVGNIANNYWILGVFIVFAEYLFFKGIIEITKRTRNIFLAGFWLCTAIIMGIFSVMQFLSEKRLIPPFIIEFRENRQRKLAEQLIIGIFASLIGGAIISLLFLS